MFLDAIVADVDERITRLLPVEKDLTRRAEAMPPARSLAQALMGPHLAVVAECKQRSPSKGWLTHDYDPVGNARRYQQDGAAAISVLTEPRYFAGDLAHLRAVRDAVELPVLRKDFVRHPVQLCEARAAGADAALLIVRILDEPILTECLAVATHLGLEVLVEAHTAGEVERALSCGATIVGINNRDLDSFETHLEFSAQMASMLPSGVIGVCESGIRERQDLEKVAQWGYHAALVGESLMRGGSLLREWTHDYRQDLRH